MTRSIVLTLAFALASPALAHRTMPRYDPTYDPTVLPPGFYPMTKGPVNPATFHAQAWQHHGVTVLLDGHPIPACLTANTLMGFVEMIEWKEVPGGLHWNGRRVVGHVEIKFRDARVRKEFLQWARQRRLIP
jgi:hypothetical protein